MTFLKGLVRSPRSRPPPSTAESVWLYSLLSAAEFWLICPDLIAKHRGWGTSVRTKVFLWKGKKMVDGEWVFLTECSPISSTYAETLHLSPRNEFETRHLQPSLTLDSDLHIPLCLGPCHLHVGSIQKEPITYTAPVISIWDGEV